MDNLDRFLELKIDEKTDAECHRHLGHVHNGQIFPSLLNKYSRKSGRERR